MDVETLAGECSAIVGATTPTQEIYKELRKRFERVCLFQDSYVDVCEVTIRRIMEDEWEKARTCLLWWCIRSGNPPYWDSDPIHRLTDFFSSPTKTAAFLCRYPDIQVRKS